MTEMSAVIPVMTISEANRRQHWTVRHRRARAQRRAAYWHLYVTFEKCQLQTPLTIQLKRIGPRLIKDGDNLQNGLKAVRDGVADWLGIDDGNPGLRWEYLQEKAKTHGVVVIIRKDEHET